MPARRPISSPLFDRADARAELAGLDAPHRRFHPLEAGRKMLRAQRSETNAATTITARKIAPMPASMPYFSSVNGRSQEADIQHADALSGAVDERPVGRHVPVVDDEGAVEPGVAVPSTSSRTLRDTRVPIARSSGALPNRRTLVLMRTSSRNSVAVPLAAERQRAGWVDDAG